MPRAANKAKEPRDSNKDFFHKKRDLVTNYSFPCWDRKKVECLPGVIFPTAK